MLGFIFWIEEQVLMVGTYYTSCFGWIIKYLQLVISQIQAELYILSNKTGIYDLLGKLITKNNNNNLITYKIE